ncbi:MAG: rane protein [Bacteroidota bacterium]|nr:rane protein [Bacteroidota bacterium]
MKGIFNSIEMKSLSTFRLIALLEGISFLILIFIAMPLKYMMDMPLPVRIVGMAHGILFVAYVFFLLMVKIDRKWSLWKTALAFIASLVPFGTFVLDAKVLKPESKIS